MGLFSKKPKFDATSTYGLLKVNDDAKQCKIQGMVFNYDDLVSFELVEDGTTVTQGGVGIGNAAVGGALFGTEGAAIGALSKIKKEDKHYCTNMQILLTLKNTKQGSLLVPLITFKTDKSKTIYKLAQANAKATLSGLNYIISNRSEDDPKDSAFSDLTKLKDLLDNGIITEDEFDTKKKEMLKRI